MFASMARRNAGTQYMLLANNLIGRIKSGDFPSGSLLPTEDELGTQFNVSRITVRSALRELETKGLVSRRPGIGTRVEKQTDASVFTHVGDTVDEVLQFTKGIPFRVLSHVEAALSPAMAQALDLPQGQRFLQVTGVRGVNGQPPVVYSRHYIPALQAPNVRVLDGAKVSLAHVLAEAQGDEVFSIRQQIEATRIGRAEADVLQCKPGASALRTTRTYYGRGDRLLLLSVSVFPSERYRFTSMLRRESTR